MCLFSYREATHPDFVRLVGRIPVKHVALAAPVALCELSHHAPVLQENNCHVYTLICKAFENDLHTWTYIRPSAIYCVKIKNQNVVSCDKNTVQGCCAKEL